MAITHLRMKLKCLHYRELDSLRRNGGAGLTKRAWKCNQRAKKVTGQTIPTILEHQLGKEWRSRVMNEAEMGPGEKDEYHTGNETVGKRPTVEGGAGNKTVIVPKRTWEAMSRSIDHLSRQLRETKERYDEVYSTLRQTNRRFERVENESAIRNPNPWGSRGAGAKEGTETGQTNSKDAMAGRVEPSKECTPQTPVRARGYPVQSAVTEAPYTHKSRQSQIKRKIKGRR